MRRRRRRGEKGKERREAGVVVRNSAVGFLINPGEQYSASDSPPRTKGEKGKQTRRKGVGKRGAKDREKGGPKRSYPH